MKLKPGLKWIPCGLCLVLVLFLVINAVFLDILNGVSFSRAYFDRSGKLLNIFLTPDDKYRLRANLADFPPALIEATLLQEDRYFYGHIGLNPMSMLKAGWETYVKRNRRMGASTITMQLARLRYNLYTRNLPGKIAQSFTAIFFEICYSKQEILEAYLNMVPCGGNIEGFATAAWYYFDKDVKELSLSEILSLAVIPQNPAKRAPLNRRPSTELIDSRRILYEAWLEQHPEDALLETEMDLPPFLVNRFPRRLLHLTEYLNTQLLPKALPQANLSVTNRNRTTIDLTLQNMCERELEYFLVRNRGWGIKNGSILLVDYSSMEVLAAVGSADYFDDDIQGQVNGFASKRSPGSTLKPFIYALALEQGLIHPEKMVKDTPVGFSEYTPDNFRGDFKGPLSAWYALVDSRNIPAVQLAKDIHNPDLYDFLKLAGISGLKEKRHYGLSVVLGSADLTMLELASLYAALANNGVKKELRFYTQDFAQYPAAQSTVARNTAPGERILTPAAAAITVKMLERNPAPDDLRANAGRSASVAYKTGTSIGFKDAWSIAIFDRYVLCVWLGNFSGEGNSAFIGRLSAAPLSFSIIDAILAEIPYDKLFAQRPLPPEVKTVQVCAISGDIPADDCPQLIETLFIPGVSPINRCRIHRKVYIDTRTGYRTNESEGPYIRSEVREFWPSDILEIFEAAGLPRFSPPPYPPDTSANGAPVSGFPPSIISPLANTAYIIRPGLPVDSNYNKMVLLAAADQDAGELFWFANASFLGRAKPRERFVWSPEPGLWDISVVDNLGRSSGIRVRVEMATE
ncbi:MAG: penicillin-binding protein 1C [Treponema sp.]|jgi:penicillin-binding protein 1C|nr:penicillin-binding protein 1C [Treponema sp.]